MSKLDIYKAATETKSYKKGKPITSEQYAEAIDKMMDKRFPVIPNARKGQGGVKPTQKMIINSDRKK